MIRWFAYNANLIVNNMYTYHTIFNNKYNKASNKKLKGKYA